MKYLIAALCAKKDSSQSYSDFFPVVCDVPLTIIRYSKLFPQIVGAVIVIAETDPISRILFGHFQWETARRLSKEDLLC